MTSYSQLSEKDLLLLLKEGDNRAFNEIYDRSWYSLYKIANQRLKDNEASKDIVHDVFADLWNKRSTRQIDNLYPYLHTAVRYKIYTQMARGKFTSHIVEPFECLAVSDLGADTWFQYNELEGLIKLWIDTLPEKRRKIFQLKYIDNLSTKEISQQLNISQKTVQNQILNAFNNLQRHLAHFLTLLIALYHLS